MNQFPCEKCDREFKSAVGLRVHSRVHEKAKNNRPRLKNPPVPSQTKLNLSNQNKPSEQSFAVVNITPLNGRMLQPRSVVSKESKSRVQSKLMFSCHLCEKKFKNRFNLSVHMQVHYSAKTVFSCDVCNVNFDRHSSFRKHRRSMDHERRKFIELGKVSPMLEIFDCMICGTNFDSKEELLRHSDVHLMQKPDLYCQLCDKSFKQLRVLESHLKSKIHIQKGKSNIPQDAKITYPCTICEKRFLLKSNLNTHLKNHNDVLII